MTTTNEKIERYKQMLLLNILFFLIASANLYVGVAAGTKGGWNAPTIGMVAWGCALLLAIMGGVTSMLGAWVSFLLVFCGHALLFGILGIVKDMTSGDGDGGDSAKPKPMNIATTVVGGLGTAYAGYSWWSARQAALAAAAQPSMLQSVSQAVVGGARRLLRGRR